MDSYYLVMLAFLGVIAIIDLFVGVSNDAVNFLKPGELHFPPAAANASLIW